MASITSSDSDISSISVNPDFTDLSSEYSELSLHSEPDEKYDNCLTKSNLNFLPKLINRQIYGRFTNHPRSKTEPFFKNIYYKCRYRLDEMIPFGTMHHIFMGFSICGKFFFSYTCRPSENETTGPLNLFPTTEYNLHIWSFIPGKKLKLISKYRIFKLCKSVGDLRKVMFMQFPTDPYKLICYGIGLPTTDMAYFTILTLPSPKNCRICKENGMFSKDNVSDVTNGWCLKHGYILHYMLFLGNPSPSFDPNISLAFPDHIVINTGLYIHILNISTYKTPTPPRSNAVITFEENKTNVPDSVSEFSETPSDVFSNLSLFDAVFDDFSEYDLEGNDCNKPFHELNISCEPLNVTGKSYHNTLIQNIVDPRLKLLQTNNKDYLFSVPQTSGIQKNVEKSKIDKKNAEKAYEFIEENEKFEKISLFRKKRLADKKYEFSEDNSENIVPFYSLRRERRYYYRSQRTSDFFLSPRSSTTSLRSPMQSPNSRSGQFSPGGASGRNIYCPLIRSSSHHSKPPISPKDNSSTRKFNVYSPSLDSDCSDFESKLILRAGLTNTVGICSYPDNSKNNGGLSVTDSKSNFDKPKWIKKIVRRYSSVDFENSSLVSGQSRDDYNIPIEIPLLVQTLTEQHLDVVPEFKSEHITETQLIVTQKTFDCEQFVQGRAQKLCIDAKLEFLHCTDYDVNILSICPFNGFIICNAVIKIGAALPSEAAQKIHFYSTRCIFTWNIISDEFEVIDLDDNSKLLPLNKKYNIPDFEMCRIIRKKIHIMDHLTTSKRSLRDYNNQYEICLDNNLLCDWSQMSEEEFSPDSENSNN